MNRGNLVLNSAVFDLALHMLQTATFLSAISSGLYLKPKRLIGVPHYPDISLKPGTEIFFQTPVVYMRFCHNPFILMKIVLNQVRQQL